MTELIACRRWDIPRGFKDSDALDEISMIHVFVKDVNITAPAITLEG